MDARLHVLRSRWAAIGAAVAVAVGATGLYSVIADSPASTFVAINPTRVLDTRINAGLAGQFTSATPRLLDVTGSIPVVLPGNMISTGAPVPDGATAIVANVTAVLPTAKGYVSVRPGTATGTPTTSNLNTSPGVTLPNSVTVELPTTGPNAGQIQLWFQGANTGATTHLLVDIVGYYLPGSGAQGPPGLSYIGELHSAETTAIGTSSSPPAPPGYTATVNLTAGRYLVTGDLTVKNDDTANPGLAICATYFNATKLQSPSLASVAPLNNTTLSGFADLAISNTFVLGIDGSTTVSFRCYRQGTSTAMFYWFVNMTIFKVG